MVSHGDATHGKGSSTHHLSRGDASQPRSAAGHDGSESMQPGQSGSMPSDSAQSGPLQPTGPVQPDSGQHDTATSADGACPLFADLAQQFPVDQPASDMIQILSPDGVRTDRDDLPVHVSDAQLVDAYEKLVMARRLDIEGTNLQRHGELGLWPPLIGQEATQVGAWLALGSADQVFPTYREQALATWMGVELSQVLATWRGTAHCPWDTVATHFSAYPVMIGSGTLHAVGYAMGIQRDKVADPSVDAAVLDFHGDGAMSEGDTNEAYVFAAAMKAPVVFCAVNNQWAISEPTSVQAPTSLYRRGLGFGIPSVQVDGNDVLAVAAVLSAALDHARSGRGPVMVETWTYRTGAHTTTDDPTRYRTAQTDEYWAGLDPIVRMQKYLRSRELIDDAWLAELDERAEQFGAQVRDAVHQPDPDPVALLDDVYAEPTPDVRADQRELAEWLQGGQ